MPGFTDFELQDFDLKHYMDPSALIDTLSPNDMEMWNGYNFFSDENINSSIKDDIKEENLDMDCCFSSICPNDLINSIESSLVKSNSLQDEHFDYNSLSSSSSSSSVSPDTHRNEINMETFDFVPCLLADQANNLDLNASGLLTVGLEQQNEKVIKYEVDSMSSSPCSSTCSTLPSPSQHVEQKPGQIYQIQNLQQSSNLLKKSNVIAVDKTKVKNSILPPSPPSSFGSDSESNQSCQSTKKQLVSSQAAILLSKSKNTAKNGATIVKQIKHQQYQVKANNSQAKSKSTVNNSKSNNLSSNSDDDCWPFFVSLSKLPSSGPILLTEEEKRTLIQEGHQVPTQLPLTKGEEKILKKIRRKIKNKISAQESRRKKKEYVDSLERRMENYINENQELKKRLEDLEINNKNLLIQLEKMKTSLTTQSSQSLQSTSQTNITDINQSQSNTNQFGTLIMVLVLFFTVVFGIWSPVITKDQLTSSAGCTAAASVTTASLSRPQANSASSSVAVVAVATAAAAATISIKAEAQNDESKQPKPIVAFDDEPQSLKRKFSDDEDFVSLDTSQAASQNSSIARSKTGTAVELTKVRPFIGKLPTINAKTPTLIGKPNLPVQTNQTAPQNDYIILNNSNEESQIIILNLANNNNNNNNNNISNNNNNNAQELPKNMNNIRVINSNQANSGSKLATRFRVINNGQSYNSINQAVIKLNSS